jgi:hypothetical protein
MRERTESARDVKMIGKRAPRDVSGLCPLSALNGTLIDRSYTSRFYESTP